MTASLVEQRERRERKKSGGSGRSTTVGAIVSAGCKLQCEKSYAFAKAPREERVDGKKVRREITFAGIG